ncbi:MAG TPA: DUF2079 domain-containing protein [Acidimicrobiales bacterium]|nr:DUF2079 domain-containing protein [Acidimicrobiales bacterium]
MVLPTPVKAPPETNEDQVDLDRLVQWVRRRDPVRWALGAMIAVWALVFYRLGYERQDRFATFGFDLGVYDQVAWLLSRFKEPFMTIRGLHFWGFHGNYIMVLLAPFYWLGAGPPFLLFVQVASQASGAIAVYLLGRDRLHDRWLAVGLAGVLLLNPTYQYLVWEFFHPDALAIGPFLFAYWAARTQRWKWFALAAVLAVACKEDVALSMAILGVLIVIWGDKRIGAIVAGASAVWFALVTRVIIPQVNGIKAFYDTFFGEFGSSPIEVAKNVAIHPDRAFDTATLPDRMNYYRMMFAPVGFLCFGSLSTFMIAGPMLAINVLSTFPYQREIRYHYAALVLTGIILATVEAVANLGSTASLRRFFVGLLLATSLASTVAWGPSPLSVKYHSGLWAQGADPRRESKQAAVDLVPGNESVSAIYYLVPHLSRRVLIYEFPVPWKPVNWGVAGENLDDPADVRWLVLDRTLLSADDKVLLGQLMTSEFETRFDKDDILVAQRVRPPAPAP